MKSTWILLLLSCVFFTCSSAQKSCRGHCGEAYSRGDTCHCDSECLSHNECCKNYESACTTRDSCKGRCGERFKRGRKCHCDIECVKYNQCCPDYETQCTLEDVALKPQSSADSPQRTSSLCLNSECNKPAECSTEEEPDDPEMTTDSNSQTSPDAEEDYDQEEQAITEATVSDSDTQSLADNVPEERSMNPTETEVSPTQAAVETELTDSVNQPRDPAETEGSSSPTEELSTPETSMTSPSTTPTTPEAPTETTALIPQTDRPNTTTPSDQHDQTSESNLKTTDSPPITAVPQNHETDGSNLTELKPPNPNQPEETLAPDNNPGPQKEQPQPTENEASEGMESINPTVITTEAPRIQENTKTPPTTKDSPITADSEKLEPSPTREPEKPTKPKPDDKDVLDEGNPQDYQSDANKDTNLCSGRPVNGLTTLRNGTIVVFRGHYFWMLDSRRRPGPAQGITDVWGIPSPIDTVFTRCNCQGKTYFFKGNDYWRFENNVMDPGFPKPVSDGFGLGGQIPGALSMPQYRSRKESVFFFKTGGLAQRYSYRITPQCGRNYAVYTIKKKVKRQAVPELGPEIDIRKSWRGFPSTVSSAISVRSTGGDGYKYYVFSKSKYYSLKMEGDTPVILTPRGGPGQQKSAKSWFRCPETQ